MKTDDIYCYLCEPFYLGSCCPKLSNPNMSCCDCLLWEFLQCQGCSFAEDCIIRKGE